MLSKLGVGVLMGFVLFNPPPHDNPQKSLRAIARDIDDYSNFISVIYFSNFQSMKKITVKRVGEGFALSIEQPENPEDLGIEIALTADEAEALTQALYRVFKN